MRPSPEGTESRENSRRRALARSKRFTISRRSTRPIEPRADRSRSGSARNKVAAGCARESAAIQPSLAGSHSRQMPVFQNFPPVGENPEEPRNERNNPRRSWSRCRSNPPFAPQDRANRRAPVSVPREERSRGRRPEWWRSGCASRSRVTLVVVEWQGTIPREAVSGGRASSQLH